MKKLWIRLIIIFLFFLLAPLLFLNPERSYANSNIMISEVYPNPDLLCDNNWCKNEWIEIYNPTDTSVDLADYSLVDDEATSKPLMFVDGQLLGSGEYRVLYKEDDFSFSLSNDNEKIYLRKNDDDLQTISYDHSLKGESYSFLSDGWSWTNTPTPGQPNKVNEPEQLSKNSAEENNFSKASESIAEARTSSSGEDVIVTGSVTALPGVLSDQYFYIQDDTGGIQIYSYYKRFPPLGAGNVITVHGVLSEVSGERRLKIDAEKDISIVSEERPVAPKIVEIEQINENLEGEYVKVKGRVSSTSGDTFEVSDESDHQIKVVIKSKANIDKPKMRKGDLVEVAGIVSQYKSEYRILPIEQNDVKILSDPLPLAGPENLIYIVFSAATLLLWKLFQKAKKIHLMWLHPWSSR